MLSLITRIAKKAFQNRVKTIEQVIQDPWPFQEQTFNQLIQTAKYTEFGKEHHFNEIRSIPDFQKRVPLREYEVFYPYIERVLKGEKDILWPGRVKWFAKSSGTTNDKSKFIPITKASLEDCHYEAGKDMIAVYLHHYPDSNLFRGKTLSIGGSHEISKFQSNARYGDLSAVLIENMPWFYELFRAPSKQVALMAEWEEKIRRMAEETLKENIVAIAGVPTWTLVLIQQLFEISNFKAKTLYDIWPELEVFFHGAVSFAPYRNQFRVLAPDLRYMEIYNASEGFFAFEHEPNRGDMLILPHRGIFYEFIPLESFEEEQPPTVTLSEVEVGKIYEVVISTNGGLWRYALGDTVQFTSLYPHTIKIMGRTKLFINAFGEELMIANVEEAMHRVCESMDVQVREFMAAPLFYESNGVGTHEWYIEFEKAPQDFQLFFDQLDAELKHLNSDYEAKRYMDMALKPPIFHVVPYGTFYQWMKKRGKLGGQNKVPRLANHRQFIEEMAEMIQEEGLETKTFRVSPER